MNIEELVESINLPMKHSPNQCVNCGSELPGEYATQCLICGYDLNEDHPFICPYQVMQNIKLPDKIITMCFCKLTKQQCKVKGFDFEICSTFRSLDSLKES